MIVRAVFSRAPGAPSANRLQLLGIWLGWLLGLLSAAPAGAQLAGTVGIDSDYRLRGDSLTDDHPGLSAQLSYDDPSGGYASLTGLTEIGGDARFLGVIANAGYARRVGQHATLDAGLLRSQIRAAAPDMEGLKYTEIYAGAYVGPIAGRIYYSPDYRNGRQSTFYGELEAGFEPAPMWRLSGHVGMLTYLNSSTFDRAGHTNRDWRLSLARQLGKFEIHAAVSRGGPGIYYGYQLHRKAALTIGGSVSF